MNWINIFVLIALPPAPHKKNTTKALPHLLLRFSLLASTRNQENKGATNGYRTN